MGAFDIECFLQRLREVPERQPVLEEPCYSEYLQTQVFDVLRQREDVDLRQLNLSQLQLRDLAPEHYPKMYERVTEGWTMGFNRLFRKMPAAYLKQGAFF